MAKPPERLAGLQISIARASQRWMIDPEGFETFPFADGDLLSVLPEDAAQRLPDIWGDKHILVAPGHSIRVPPVFRFSAFKGFRVPTHLISLSGGGPEVLDDIGRTQVANYARHMGLDPGMTFVDLGCGIG